VAEAEAIFWSQGQGQYEDLTCPKVAKMFQIYKTSNVKLLK